MSDRNISGTINVQANMSPAIQSLDRLTKIMEDAAKKGDKATAELAAKAIANATKMAQANNRVAESEKQLTATVRAEAAERVRIADASVANARRLTEKARGNTVRARTKGAIAVDDAKTANTLAEVAERETQKRRTVYAQRNNNEQAAFLRMKVNAEMEAEKRITSFYRDQLGVRRRLYEQDIKKRGPMSQQWQSAMNASIGRSNLMYNMAQTAAATGMSPSAQLSARINASAAASNAAYLQQLAAAGGGKGGRGGGMGGVLGRLFGMGGGGAAGSLVSSLAGGFGIGVGGYALARGITAATENVDRATAYNRQRVAAENLAGSQAQLNALLAEYQEASGGAVDASTALENVSRLLATGYAETTDEVARFVRATRGAALATGRPQDYIVQETQLAISNISFKRLDQIGLGIDEVRERMSELRSENHAMTREAAFQQSVLELMDEKYSALSESVEGQRTGVERLRAAWADLGLEMGQALKGPMDAFSSYAVERLQEITDAIAEARQGWAAGEQMYGVQSIRASGSALAPPPAWMTSATGYAGPPRGKDRFDEDQLSAIMDWDRERTAIERKSNAEMLAAQRDYAMQRGSVIRQYETQLIRGAEDFAKQRARAEEDYQDSIVELRRDSAREEQKAVEDLTKNIARARRDHEEKLSSMADDYNRQVAENLEDFTESRAEQEEEHTEKLEEIRKEGYERFEKLESDYTKQRLEAERRHRETIENAASRFDARAVYEEQRRFQREQNERLAEREEQKKEELKKLEETTADAVREYEKRQEKEQKAFDKAAGRQQAAYNRQVEAEQKNFDRQIEDMNTAFEEQRSEAAEQEEQRLLDMAAAFEKRKGREDADRAESLTRMATDHAAQLREMETQHGLRIQQIKDQALEEREQLDAEFNTRLGELQLQTEDWYTEQETLANEAIKKFDEWWNHVNGKLTELPGHPSNAEKDYINRELPVSPEDQNLLGEHEKMQDIINDSNYYSPESVNARIRQYEIEKLLKAKGIPIPTYNDTTISGVVAAGVTSPTAAAPISSTVVGGASNSYGGATYVISPGAVQIQASPGQSEEALGIIVEERLIRALERAAVAYR